LTAIASVDLLTLTTQVYHINYLIAIYRTTFTLFTASLYLVTFLCISAQVLLHLLRCYSSSSPSAYFALLRFLWHAVTQFL